ncbi:MAG: tripartite tricarboxylate transporter substrate binding protein [Betaproteobacteria bacterium]|nr:tripartite tricarboxylate transporter substrate binding protein [Betaproteobacteria bacterium]
MRIQRLLSGSVLPLCLALAAAAAPAADWPARPIRFVTPAAPGGTTDGLSRIFSARMTETLGTQVIVDNRASSSGVLAAEIVKAAAPDGYTLFMAYHQHTVNAALLKLSYHPVNDFTPITQLTEAGLALVIHPSSPPKNFKEFLDWTRNFKGPLNYGSAGHGSGGHLAGELYKIQSGVKANHIPYKGAGPSLIALMGGEFHYSFTGLVGALPLARAGKIRAVAVTTGKRIPGYEDIPTVKESGLPDFVVVGWYGVITPPKLPNPLVTRLHAELVKVLNEPAINKRIIGFGGTPVGSDPVSFRKFMLADMNKWADVVKKSGAKAD